MWAERKGVEPARLPELVQRVQVGVGVVGIVGVGGVVLQVPLAGALHVLAGPPLGLALVVDHVKPHHLLGPPGVFDNDIRIKVTGPGMGSCDHPKQTTTRCQWTC